MPMGYTRVYNPQKHDVCMLSLLIHYIIFFKKSQEKTPPDCDDQAVLVQPTKRGAINPAELAIPVRRTQPNNGRSASSMFIVSCISSKVKFF